VTSISCPAMLRAALAVLGCTACGRAAQSADARSDDASAVADAALAARVLDVVGDISPVHDPAIVATPGKYYLFSTGAGLLVHESSDLVRWRATGSVFAQKPAWITTTSASNPNELWAPDVRFFGGKYHLYYAASSFGSNVSCIGHATSASLDAASWEDHGAVICSAASDNWNAIDPAPVLDESGAPWLALGSFWGGLKLIQLDDSGARRGTSFVALATRANTAVEAAYIAHHGSFYYLFESVDFCCKGVDSTYKIMVGRSADIAGPYVDRDGVPLLAGGGTLVVTGDGRWKGPGHNAILHTTTGDYNVYHSYDARANGAPTLRVAELRWSSDGWPVSAGP